MSRLKPTERKQQILEAAIDLANEIGFGKLTRQNIAASADVSEGLVSKYWGTMTKMRRAVMRKAIKKGEMKIIAEGIAMNEPECAKLSPVARQKALSVLA